MKILFGSDEKTGLTKFIHQWLAENKYTAIEIGHLIEDQKKWRWVEIGKEIGQRISASEADFGIVCCWSGTGVCMAANRSPGARAALCWDAETARLARKWDDANILCLSLRYTSETVAKEILETWFKTPFDEEGLNEVNKLTV